jgi:hypothetical protein
MLQSFRSLKLATRSVSDVKIFELNGICSNLIIWVISSSLPRGPPPEATGHSESALNWESFYKLTKFFIFSSLNNSWPSVEPYLAAYAKSQISI